MSPLVLPIFAQALSVVIGARSEVRLRADATGRFVDIADTGQVALNLKLRRTSWTLAYAPSLTQTGVGSDTPGRYLVHWAGLSLRLRLTPRTTVMWSENATYGEQNFRIQTVSVPPPTIGNGAVGGASGSGSSTVNPAPAVSNSGQSNAAAMAATGNNTIRFGSLSNNLNVQYVLAHRWTAGALASYTLMGELDSYVPVLLPRMRAYQAGLQLTHAASRRDTITLESDTNYTLIEPNAKSEIVSATVTGIHTLNRRAFVTAFGSGYYVHFVDLSGNRSSAVLPGTGASFTTAFALPPRPSRLTVTTTASIAPLIDYRYGGVNNLATVNAAFAWADRPVSLQVGGSAARSVGSFGAVTILSVYALTETLGYQLDRRNHWLVTVGSRQAKQTYAAGPQLPLVWVAFAAISYTTGILPL